jgi:hypothetical protein
MPHQQPGASEDLLLLLLVDRLIDKDLAADVPPVQIDQMLHRMVCRVCGHRRSPSAC